MHTQRSDPLRRRRVLRGALTLVATLALGSGFDAPPQAQAARNLVGRMAPDLSFQHPVQGVAQGSRISSMRGEVVLLTFWLADCPVCRRHLPSVQSLHRRYAGLGLRVVTIVHKVGTQRISPLLRKQRWTFPVATDPDGRMAASYGVGRRPVDVLIDARGRVLRVGRVGESVLKRALSQWRVGRIRSWPQGTEAVRGLVARGDYPGALRAGGDRVPGLLAEARRDLQARARRFQPLRPANRAAAARFRALYTGTPLASEAQALLGGEVPVSSGG